MREFVSVCIRCDTEFTESLPRVWCPPCRPIVAAEMAKRAEENRVKFYLEHPYAPMPGDKVRFRTKEDDEFERDVTADLAVL